MKDKVVQYHFLRNLKRRYMMFPSIFMQYLKKHLTQEWRDVGRHLGLSESDIDHINCDHSNSQDKSYAMLLKWKRVSGRQATLSTLVEALRKSERNDLADKLIEDTGGRPNKKQDNISVVTGDVNTRAAERLESNKILTLVVYIMVITALVGIAYFSIPTLLEGAGRIGDSWQTLAAGRGQHNLVMGKRVTGDQLLYEEKIRKGHSLLPIFYQTHIFTFNCKENESITCVVVEDGWDDDTGGEPVVVDGGPDECYVKIKVTSMIGRGMDFKFYVYGRK